MTNPNAPAFPAGSESVCADKRGLTKREYFAGLAMQGMLSAINGIDGSTHGQKHIAEKALEMAGALIAELNKGEPK